MATTCKHCVAAGVDPDAVTFENGGDFYQHTFDEHYKTEGAPAETVADRATVETPAEKPRKPRANRATVETPAEKPRKPRAKK